MRCTQFAAALLVGAVIGLPRAGSAQSAPAPTILNTGIVAPVGGLPAPGDATLPAAPLATGLAGTAAPQPLDPVKTLTGFEDSGGPYRTAVGVGALFHNNTTGGYYNTASGYGALFSNTGEETTRPAATWRSLPTSRAVSTRPAACMRSLPTPRAA